MSIKIYISGAISGTTDYQERFEEAETELKKMGYSVINPAKINAMLPKDTTWEEYMKMSICMLEMCDYIYMLKNWENSKGACMEMRKALESNITLLFQK